MKSNLKITGKVTIELIDKDGVLKHKLTKKNLVVSNGEYFVANRISGNTASDLSHIAIGSGTTDPTSANTDVVSQLGKLPFATGPTQGTGVDQDKITMTVSFGAGDATGTISEAGLYYGVTSLFSRVVFTGVVKSATDALNLTWIVEVVG